MASIPKFSTLITWALYFIPIYLFVVDPLLRGFFPSLLAGSPSSSDDLFDESGAPGPGINLTDDSFISPEDGVPFQCPDAEGYRVHLLSRTPLIMYIENFVSENEANQLLDMR
jgi:prolyl 4-hydroxylase